MHPTKNPKTGRYQLRFRDSNGCQQRRSSKKDFPAGIKAATAQTIANQIIEDHENALLDIAKPLLADCVERMLKRQEWKKIKGIKTLRGHARRALEWDNYNNIDDIAKVAIKMRDDMLSQTKPNGEPYSGNYIKKLLDVFTQTANLAYQEWDILDQPLALKIKGVKIPKSRTRWLTQEEAAQLLEACDEYTGAAFQFMLLTGIRHAEFQRLKAGDIKNGMITIDGKTGHMRSFRISDEAIDAANIIKFPNSLSYDVLSNALSKAKKDTGIKDVTIHDFRHTFATWLAQSGTVSLQKLQEVMGHANINQTTKYAHLMPSHLDGVADSLSLKWHKKNDTKLTQVEK